MTDAANPLLRDLWRRQRAWSRAADRAKAEIGRYRVASLLLVVLAAVLGAAAPVVRRYDDPAGRFCGLAAGISLGLIPIIRRRLGVSMYQAWSRQRSISEALKVEVYTFLAGVEPYRTDDRVQVLQARSTDILRKGDDLLGQLRRGDRRERPLPAVRDIASYLTLRVEQQVRGYYQPKARQMGRRARQVRLVESGLAIAAVVLGVFASTGRTGVAPWIGVIGTVSGALIAHSAAARFSFLQLEYLRTVEQLNRIVAEYQHGRVDDDRADRLVGDCERVISFQNEAWMAEVVTNLHDEPDARIPPPV